MFFFVPVRPIIPPCYIIISENGESCKGFEKDGPKSKQTCGPRSLRCGEHSMPDTPFINPQQIRRTGFFGKTIVFILPFSDE